MRNQAESLQNPLYRLLLDQNQRLENLERALIKRRKRNKATDAQRFLLLFHSGSLAAITGNSGLSQGQKAQLVSTIIDIDVDNAKKYLSEIAKADRPLLDTISNYTFLFNFYNNAKDVEQAKKMDLHLLKLTAEKIK
jgi:hypothetical protein